MRTGGWCPCPTLTTPSCCGAASSLYSTIQAVSSSPDTGKSPLSQSGYRERTPTNWQARLLRRYRHVQTQARVLSKSGYRERTPTNWQARRRYRHLQAQARVLSANQITERERRPIGKLDYSGGIVISRHRQESSQPIRLQRENADQLASSITPAV